MTESTPAQDDTPAEPATPSDFAPQWGQDAPRGGKTVMKRALKDGGRVPLFFGQTLINSLRDLGYNSTTSAVCEHVDNALDAGAKEVRVYFRQSGKQPNQKIDVLVYDDGCGMAANTLKVATAFGGSPRFDNRSGIGRYGMGMKAAALNIARRVDVFSWQEPAAFFKMTLDVDAIGNDRSDLIELPEPQMTDVLPSEIADILTKPTLYPSGTRSDELIAVSADDLETRLSRSGTIVYMTNCDRLSPKTERTLVDHAVTEFARVYRRFLDRGVRLYVNNRRVEAFDPTYWMKSARHTKIEGLTTKQSNLIDSFEVQVPITEGSRKTTEGSRKTATVNTATVRIRMFLLPVYEWSSLPWRTQHNDLQIFDGYTVSYLRNDREVDVGIEPKLGISKHHRNAWFRVEIAFPAELDEAFGVAANKQGVRLKQHTADAILEASDGRFARVVVEMKAVITQRKSESAAAAKAGQVGDAERLAGEADALQAVALIPPAADTPEQVAALEANLRGLATSLRLDNETEDQAFERVRGAKFLTDIRHQEYAPFYDTDYRFGKLILRVNPAHPFYQKVWQPLAELSAAPVTGSDDPAAATTSGEAGRRALLGLQMLLLALARAQVQMTSSDPQGEQALLFRNLRKAWSDVLETQLLNV